MTPLPKAAPGALARLDAALRQIAPGPLGLAVSGGGDSMALLVASAKLSIECGWNLRVATVNHGLRPEALDEALMVARICADLGLSHQILTWSQKGPVTGNLMDQARRERYRLLADWASAQGIARVAIAHTADDQAETVLMGLARASGPDGLSGLRPTWVQNGVTFLRPLLGVTRADLRGFLKEEQMTWVEDPTNLDQDYERSRVRRALSDMGQIGLTVEALASVARTMAEVQESLRVMTRQAAGRVVRERAGALFFDPVALAREPAEVQRRLVLSAVQWISPQSDAPRAAALARFQAAVLAQRPATLAGVVTRPKGQLSCLMREPAALGPMVPIDQIWDGKWRVVPVLGEAQHGRLTLGPLGYAGLAQLERAELVAQIPRDVLAISPAVWHDEKVIAAPFAEKHPLWRAKLAQEDSIFVLSH